MIFFFHEQSTFQYCCISEMYQSLLCFPPSRHKSALCYVGWHVRRLLILCSERGSPRCSICAQEDSLSITRHKCPCLIRQIGNEKQILTMLQKHSLTPGTLCEIVPALQLLCVQGTSRANRLSTLGQRLTASLMCLLLRLLCCAFATGRPPCLNIDLHKVSKRSSSPHQLTMCGPSCKQHLHSSSFWCCCISSPYLQ